MQCPTVTHQLLHLARQFGDAAVVVLCPTSRLALLGGSRAASVVMDVNRQQRADMRQQRLACFFGWTKMPRGCGEQQLSDCLVAHVCSNNGRCKAALLLAPLDSKNSTTPR